MTRVGDGDGDALQDESHRTGPGTNRLDPGQTPKEDAGEKSGDAGEASDETGVADQTYYCDLCGSVMLNLHCKLICETCGYKRDCSDP